MCKSNIALVGFMATGKSTIGKHLAEKMGKKFIEMDSMIVDMAGKSIPDIFAQDGEITFREYEMAVCKKISSMGDCVISTGGGVIMNKLNIDYLKLSSHVILLLASEEKILERCLSDGKEKRPKFDPEGFVSLLKFRDPFYRAATDKQIDTDNMSFEEVVIEIEKII